MKKPRWKPVLLLAVCFLLSISPAALAAPSPAEQMLSLADASLARGNKAITALNKKYADVKRWAEAGANKEGYYINYTTQALFYSITKQSIEENLAGLRAFVKWQKSGGDASKHGLKDMSEKDGAYTFAYNSKGIKTYTYEPKSGYLRCECDVVLKENQVVKSTMAFYKAGAGLYVQGFTEKSGEYTRMLLSKSAFQLCRYKIGESAKPTALTELDPKAFKTWKAFSSDASATYEIKNNVLTIVNSDGKVVYK